MTAAAAGVPGAWVSNASTGIVLPALVQSSPKLCRLWLETTLYVPEGRTSMPSKASREAPSTVAGSGVTVRNAGGGLHELDRAHGRCADLRRTD